MQVERCVELHNQILRYGWIGSGNSPDSFEANCRIWDHAHGAEAEAVYPHLIPDLVKFLKHARIAYIPETKEHSFFYWVDDLAPPGLMFYMEESFTPGVRGEDQVLERRYVDLYTMNDFGSHRLGLIFDQQTHLSIDHMAPLETILGAWLDSILRGNIDAVPENGGKYPLEFDLDFMGQNYPWVQVPYSELMLKDTLEAFNSLVGAIEARLPTDSPMDSDDIEYGLVDEGVLQSMDLPQRFAYKFLRRVRRPRFQMIAPGLEIPDSSSFSMQPFWSDGATNPAILLFRSKHNYVNSFRAPIKAGFLETNILGSWVYSCLCKVFKSNMIGSLPKPQFLRQLAKSFQTMRGSTSEEHEQFDHPFGYPIYQISTFAAGLYLLPPDESEDEFKFVLPFGIGANGYARKSDGSRFGENSESDCVVAKDKCADLYGTGYSPFDNNHENRLVGVLKSWLGMVERGDWKIDQYGVAGGIDVWREADTEQGWEKYVIPVVAN